MGNTLLINSTDHLSINSTNLLNINTTSTGISFTQEELRTVMDKLYGYFTDNRGDTKPNAANSLGIPYHCYEAGYHWQTHECSTTTECITLMCRAMIEAGYINYGKQLADFFIHRLIYNDVPAPHWLINLIDNGVEMETAIMGNYSNAVFSFVNGVATIPAGSPWYGERVIPVVDDRYYGVRGCWTTDSEFPWEDYWVAPVESASTEYEIDSYSVSETGCEITLIDTSFTGNLQVYYGYRNQDILDRYDLYGTYPLNYRAVRTSLQDTVNILINNSDGKLLIGDGNWIAHTTEFDYDLSCAVDGVLWGSVALRKLAAALAGNEVGIIGNAGVEILLNDTEKLIYGNEAATYSDKADELMANLDVDGVVKDADYYIFDATSRGVSWYYLFTYDQYGGRNPLVSQQESNWARFTFDAGTGVAQWGISNNFVWTSDDLVIKVRGTNSGQLRQIAINDDYKTYYYPWMDNSNEEKELRIARDMFSNRDPIWLEAGRLPYLIPYTVGGYGGSSSYAIVNYNDTHRDSEGLNYPIWYRWNYYVTGTGSFSIFGASHTADFVTTVENRLRITIAADKTVKVYYKCIDANGSTIQGKYYIEVSTDIKEFYINFDSNYFQSAPVHPITHFELFVADVSASGSIYIASWRINPKRTPAAQLITLLFETIQTTAGYWDTSYAYLEQGNIDIYPNAGVPVFSLEYDENGRKQWRSGSYPGYTNPTPFLGGNYNSYYAAKFIYDAQMAYKRSFNTAGPMYPVYLRNLSENVYYGELQTWGFNGPDPNTPWAGFQFRAVQNMADHRYFNRTRMSAQEIGFCWNVLNIFCNFIYWWIKLYDNLPSNFNEDGTITHEYDSPDFYAQIGRAMLLKHLIDWDSKSLFIYLWCYDKLIEIQQPNGSFKCVGGETYGFHQAEIMLFLAELYNYYEEYKYSSGMTTFTWNCNKVHTAAIEFRTQVFESYSGKEQRVSETIYPIRRWRLTFDKNNSELTEIRAYFNNIGARYSTFNWTWDATKGGDGNNYTCRLVEDEMVAALQHLGYGNFDFVFEAIDDYGYTTLTEFNQTYNKEYEHKEIRKTNIDQYLVANRAVNLQWQSSRKRWDLMFEKNKESRQWLENFFISQKGRYGTWQFTWSEALGGDGETYNVRFDTDVLDFDVTYYGFGKFRIPIIEVL